MWKLIFKNIWSRRRKNAWFMMELIIISVITWIVLDPVIVRLYSKNLPLGYTPERLVMINVVTKEKEAADFDQSATDSASVARNNRRIMDFVKALPEVERVTPLHSNQYVNSINIQTAQFFLDGKQIYAPTLRFLPGMDYLQTYGFESVSGSPDVRTLDNANYGPDDILVTENLAKYFNMSDKMMDRKLKSYLYYRMDTVTFRVRGILKNFAMRRSDLPYPVIIIPNFNDQEWVYNIKSWNLLVRLKEGISPQQFLNTYREQMMQTVGAGNQYIRSLHPYTDELDSYEYWSGTTQKVRTNILLAVFFFISLLLGVIGAFWLQTRKRSEEAGIMRSFGATPGYILRMLLGEGVVLTTIACIIGFTGYLQYALLEGLDLGMSSYQTVGDHWVHDFWTHFGLVSLIVYLLLLAIVLLGVYIPARNISQVNPVDALKDE